MQSGDWPGLSETQPGKVPDVQLPGRGIDLIDSEHDRPPGPHQQARHVGVRLRRPDRHVHNKQNSVSFFDRLESLRGYQLVEHHAADLPASRVDEGEVAPHPLGLERLTVAGDARSFLDDRLATSEYPVHKGGLAHVGPPDDRHHGPFAAHLRNVIWR